MLSKTADSVRKSLTLPRLLSINREIRSVMNRLAGRSSKRFALILAVFALLLKAHCALEDMEGTSDVLSMPKRSAGMPLSTVCRPTIDTSYTANTFPYLFAFVVHHSCKRQCKTRAFSRAHSISRFAMVSKGGTFRTRHPSTLRFVTMCAVV